MPGSTLAITVEEGFSLSGGVPNAARLYGAGGVVLTDSGIGWQGQISDGSLSFKPAPGFTKELAALLE